MKWFLCAALLFFPIAAMAQVAPPHEKCEGALSMAFAQEFADEWIASWNSHDLSRVLKHYTDDFEMRSPFIITSSTGDLSGALRGKSKVAAYWGPRIDSQNFELIGAYAGVRSVTIYYRRLTAPVGSGVRVAAEVLEFNSSCQVVRGSAHYGER